MRLKKIISNLNIKIIKNFKDYNIKTITHVSSDIVSSSMFLCIKGNNFNGNDYIEEAVGKGAKCIVTEDDCNIEGVCVVVVEDVRIAMSIVAKNFYNRCVDTMKIIGVVGTSGKTTTTHMICQILSKNDNKIGIIGTNGIFIDNIRLDNKFTTPDPIDLHYIFYQMKMFGVDIVVMEVSAQSIYYKKIYGINFDICVFTNISKEHLDFFGTLENYVKVKMNFFNKNHVKECVVNIDDFYGRELAYKVDFPCVSYGIFEPANSFAIDINYNIERTDFVANILDDVFKISMPYVGEYNVYNLLASLTVAKMMGMTKDQINSAIHSLYQIDGRFNVINVDNKKIIIDFAHTPESIDKLLSHVKKFSSRNIISVFGCVGYSDKEKRIQMAEAVSKYSDYIIVTTDNRGNTKFEDICKDIVLGLNNTEYICIENRFLAIKYGYEMMNKDDILVLIGKGAENFQNIDGERLPYSDIESVNKIVGEKLNEIWNN